MLDLMISIDNDKIVATPALDKAPLPLCVSSCHSPHVHRAWPAAVARRIATLSDNAVDAHNRLVRNYAEACAHPATLRMLRSAFSRVEQQPAEKLSGERVMCILRYHPVLARALTLTLKQVPIPPSFGLRIVPSWRNGLKSIHTIVEMASDIKGSGTRLAESSEEGMSLLFSHRNQIQNKCLKHVTSLSLICDKLKEANMLLPRQSIQCANLNALARV